MPSPQLNYEIPKKSTLTAVPSSEKNISLLKPQKSQYVLKSSLSFLHKHRNRNTIYSILQPLNCINIKYQCSISSTINSVASKRIHAQTKKNSQLTRLNPKASTFRLKSTSQLIQLIAETSTITIVSIPYFTQLILKISTLMVVPSSKKGEFIAETSEITVRTPYFLLVSCRKIAATVLSIL